MRLSPNKPNPYTCRLLIRVDALLWKLRGADVYWADDGKLCERMEKGHGVELRTHFPGSWFIAAAKLQNRWLCTRRVLSV